MPKFKIEDIKPNSLVLFKKHNGKGRRNTYRAVFVSRIWNDEKSFSIAYDSFEGTQFATLRHHREKINDFEILDIKYFEFNSEEKGLEEIKP